MADNVAKLIVRAGLGRVGQEILLVEDVTTLGRAGSCQVILDNDFTSRRHAQIVRRDEVYWLRDLGSKNGTLLDGQPVTQEALLSDGAEIAIGPVVLRFVDPAATRTQTNLALSALLRVDVTSREVWAQGQKLSPPLTS
ncbi:MAG: FHA domain-containing protein, partial [Anaerolineae bacterium]